MIVGKEKITLILILMEQGMFKNRFRKFERLQREYIENAFFKKKTFS